jgi:membrane protein YqaA with SNARE-associated domain
MTAFFRSIFWFFLTWWGTALMAALDSSMLFFMPFGVDALVIYLAARNKDLFWLYPLLACAGSVTGGAVTYWIGKKVGEVGLERFVDEKRLERIREKLQNGGAIALAIPALLPPPFPLTPVVLACGALKADWRRFFITFALARLLRFAVEAVLARQYGRRILQVLESDTFQTVISAFVVVAVVGPIVSGVALWKKTRPRPQPA